jgi:hypothetical protein
LVSRNHRNESADALVPKDPVHKSSRRNTIRKNVNVGQNLRRSFEHVLECRNEGAWESETGVDADAQPAIGCHEFLPSRCAEAESMPRTAKLGGSIKPKTNARLCNRQRDVIGLPVAYRLKSS